MSELRLQVGEWYQQRSGAIVGPVNEIPKNLYYRFRVGDKSYNRHGRFCSDYYVSEQDIVSHVPRTDPRHPDYKPGSETVSLVIDIPAPPEGWQVDGYRIPVAGEMRYSYGQWRHVNGCCCFKWPVAVRSVPLWLPPAWMATGWVTADDGDVFQWWSQKPEYRRNQWQATGGIRLRIIPAMLRDWTPPPITGKHAIWEVK